MTWQSQSISRQGAWGEAVGSGCLRARALPEVAAGTRGAVLHPKSLILSFLPMSGAHLSSGDSQSVSSVLIQAWPIARLNPTAPIHFSAITNNVSFYFFFFFKLHANRSCVTPVFSFFVPSVTVIQNTHRTNGDLTFSLAKQGCEGDSLEKYLFL